MSKATFIKVWCGILMVMVFMYPFKNTAFAEQLEDKNLTVTAVWYQPHLLGSVEEAAETLSNLRNFYTDWAGGEIKELNVDRFCVRLMAVINWIDINTEWVPPSGGTSTGSTFKIGHYETTQIPHFSLTLISIPTTEITGIELLQFPLLECDNTWGINIRLINGTNITLRTKDYESARKVADAITTLAVINGCKLSSPTE